VPPEFEFFFHLDVSFSDSAQFEEPDSHAQAFSQWSRPRRWQMLAFHCAGIRIWSKSACAAKWAHTRIAKRWGPCDWAVAAVLDKSGPCG